MSAKTRRPPAKALKKAASAPRRGSASPLATVLVLVALGAPLVSFGAGSQIQAVDAVAGFMGLAAAAIGVWLLLLSKPATAPRRVGVAWALFLAWTLAGAVLSGRFWSSFSGQPGSQMGWAALAAGTVLALAARLEPRDIRSLLLRFGPVFLLAQAVAVFIQLGVGQMPRGSLPNSTYFGEMVLLLLPFAFDPKTLETDRAWQGFALPVVMVSALAASGSRVATVVATAWAVWTIGRSKRFSARIRRQAVAVIVIAVVAAGLVFARGEIMGTTSVSSLGDRPAMLHIALAAVKAKPVAGWGMEGFSTGGAAVSTPELAASGPMVPVAQGFSGDPHNLVANLAVSAGIVGLALFLWFAVELALAWRRRAGRDSTGAWAVAGLAVVLLTAPMPAHVLPLLAIVVGMSLARDGDSASEGESTSQSAARWAGSVHVALLALAVLVSAVFGLNRLTHVPFDEYNPEVSPRKAASAQRMADTWRIDPQLYYLASLHWGYAVQSDPVASLARPDIAAIREAARLDPLEPYYQLELALTLKFYREPPEVVDEAFAETFRRYPLFPMAHADYAKYLAEQERFEEARQQLAIARTVKDPSGSVDGTINLVEGLLKEK